MPLSEKGRVLRVAMTVIDRHKTEGVVCPGMYDTAMQVPSGLRWDSTGGPGLSAVLYGQAGDATSTGPPAELQYEPLDLAEDPAAERGDTTAHEPGRTVGAKAQVEATMH